LGETELELSPIKPVVESALDVRELELGIGRGLSVLVSSGRGSSTIGRCGGLRSRCRLRVELGAMTTDDGKDLVTLGALRDLEALLIGPLLQLAVRVRLEQSVGDAFSRSSGGCRDGRGPSSKVIRSNAGVAANRGDQLITLGWLRDGNAALITPRLEVGLGPRFVDPITRVRGSLANLVGSSLVVLADSLEKRIASARLGNWDAVLVGECLELRFGSMSRRSNP